MTAYFADTSFWIALSYRRDAHHARAVEWSIHLARANAAIITTEAVMWEWMNALSRPDVRRTASAAYRECHLDPRIEVVPFHADLIAAAIDLFAARFDKAWSLTDCMSFILMHDRHVRQALTSDRHFEQAGFKAVLLGDVVES